MSRNPSRREQLLEAAITAFVDRGYEGTSVAELAKATGLSKAAFVYHFESKEHLMRELAEPLLDDLGKVVEVHEAAPHGKEPIRAAITDYFKTLWSHREVAEWVDGDKAILNHKDLGEQLNDSSRRMHRILTSKKPSKLKSAQASAILGMLWRPLRGGFIDEKPRTQQAIIDMATAAARKLE